VALVGRKRLQLRLLRVVLRRRGRERQRLLELRAAEATGARDGGHQRVRAARRRAVPHVLVLRARRGGCERSVRLHRLDADGPRRGGARPVLGAPPRRVRPVSQRAKPPAQLERALKALADPQRVAILRLVRGQELAAGEIATHFATTRQAVSQSLALLTRS